MERKSLLAAVSALSLSNAFFIVKKLSTAEKAYQAVRTMTEIFRIEAVDGRTVKKALQSGFADFEDAVQYQSALQFRASVILSRDFTGFSHSRIAVMDCTQYLTVERLDYPLR